MLNKNRESYKFFAMVYNALNKYSCDENEENAKQTFEFSLNGFEMKKIEDDSEIYKDYPEIVKFNNSNIDAVLEISKILQVDYKKSR